MRIRHQPTGRLRLLILTFVLLLITAESRAQIADSAEYAVSFKATWSAASHPLRFPSGPHFSSLVGGVHSSAVSFWEEGGTASEGMERMAEAGRTSPLSTEVEDAIADGNALQVLLGNSIRPSTPSVRPSNPSRTLRRLRLARRGPTFGQSKPVRPSRPPTSSASAA